MATAAILRSEKNRAFIRYLALRDGVRAVAITFGLSEAEVRAVLAMSSDPHRYEEEDA